MSSSFFPQIPPINLSVYSGTLVAVDTYASLPAASSHNNEVWIVKTSSGGYSSGLYSSNGSVWAYVGDTDEATWGKISGTITDQSDLAYYLATKVPLSAIDTDNTLSANSDSRIASQKATKYYVDHSPTSGVPYVGATQDVNLGVHNIGTDGRISLQQQMILPITGWKYVKALTFTFTNYVTTMTDFPVLVTIVNDADLYANAQSAGQDIRFYSSDFSTAIPYVIDSWTIAAGTVTASFWINPGALNLNLTPFHWNMLYGNAGASDGQSLTSTFTKYARRWGCQASPLTDSVASKTLTTTNGSAAFAAGLSGNALNLTAGWTVSSSDYAGITMGANPLSVMFWFKLNSTTNAYKRILSIGGNGGTKDCLEFWTYGTTMYVYNGYNRSGFSVNNTCSSGVWHYFCFGFSGSNAIVFQKDGITYSSTASSNWALNLLTNNPIVVGAGGSTDGGYLDELRIGNFYYNTQNWQKHEYENYNPGVQTTGAQTVGPLTYLQKEGNTIGEYINGVRAAEINTLGIKSEFYKATPPATAAPSYIDNTGHLLPIAGATTDGTNVSYTGSVSAGGLIGVGLTDEAMVYATSGGGLANSLNLKYDYNNQIIRLLAQASTNVDNKLEVGGGAVIAAPSSGSSTTAYYAVPETPTGTGITVNYLVIPDAVQSASANRNIGEGGYYQNVGGMSYSIYAINPFFYGPGQWVPVFGSSSGVGTDDGYDDSFYSVDLSWSSPDNDAGFYYYVVKSDGHYASVGSDTSFTDNGPSAWTVGNPVVTPWTGQSLNFGYVSYEYGVSSGGALYFSPVSTEQTIFIENPDNYAFVVTVDFPNAQIYVHGDGSSSDDSGFGPGQATGPTGTGFLCDYCHEQWLSYNTTNQLPTATADWTEHLWVWSRKIVNLRNIFSPTYLSIDATIDYTGHPGEFFEFNWTWGSVGGVDGYRVFRQNESLSPVGWLDVGPGFYENSLNPYTGGTPVTTPGVALPAFWVDSNYFFCLPTCTPPNSSAPGSEGAMCRDNNYIYVYTGGQWTRSGLSGGF
jgi:hypothetical protein